MSHAPKIHSTRPSAEPLFASMAVHYGDRAVAVVLTGGDGDGSEALQAIREHGGTVIAQDQQTSEVFGMPQAAIATG